MSDFDLYRLSEDYEALREAVRAVVEAKVATHAADVDEKSAFPQEAYDALRAADFHAPHVPEQYGGVGADALATCLVIEEVARGCASSSLIPAVNKLGTMPLLLAANDDIKARYLPPVASGESMFSYGLSEREAGSDTASMRCRATLDGDEFVLNGQKSWITNAGISDYYTVMAVTDPDAPRGQGVTAFVVEKSDEGFTFGELERKLGIKGSPTRELPSTTAASRRPDGRRARSGAEDRAAHPRPHPGHDRRAGLRHRPGRAGRRRRVREGAQAVRQGGRGVPGRAVHARRHGHEAGGRAPDGLRGGREERALGHRPDLLRAAAKRYASDVAMEVTTDAVQLLGGAGYVKDFPLERMMRDAKITQIYEGTNQIQRLVMARQLLKLRPAAPAIVAGT